MKEWNTRDFIRMLRENGFYLAPNRGKGDHSIYKHADGRHISVPLRIAAPIARRLIKENKLNVNL